MTAVPMLPNSLGAQTKGKKRAEEDRVHKKEQAGRGTKKKKKLLSEEEDEEI